MVHSLSCSRATKGESVVFTLTLTSVYVRYMLNCDGNYFIALSLLDHGPSGPFPDSLKKRNVGLLAQ